MQNSLEYSFDRANIPSNVSGQIKDRVPDLPIVTLAEAKAIVGLGETSWTPAVQKKDRERWNDWGIGLLLQGDLKGAEYAFKKVTEAEPEYADGWITGFCRRGDPRPNYHFFSAQVVARSVFADLPDGVPAESVLRIYPGILADTPRRLRAFICDAPFIEVGTPADYRRVHERLAAEDGVSPWTPGKSAVIDPTARLDRTILWDDVTIGAGVVLERCVVADRVRVPDGLRAADACLVPWPGDYALRPGERREADVLIVPDTP
jgi:hypothetical protein